MKRILTTLAVAAMLLCSSTAQAASLTMAELLAGGTLINFDKIFFNFRNFTQDDTFLLVDPSDIVVSTITDTVLGEPEWGIRFEHNWNLNGPNQHYDLGFDFNVAILPGFPFSITDNTLSIVGGGNGDFDAHVAEGVTDPANLNTLANKFVFISTQGTKLIDHQDFPYWVTVLEIHKDFGISTGPGANSNVFVSHFDQTFSQDAVPEPGTWLLVGGAAPILVALVRRRRRKNQSRAE